jgi:hypothetical protein
LIVPASGYSYSRRERVIFIHYSDEPVLKIEDRRQQASADSRGSKPIGLWLSVVEQDGTDSWQTYCETRNWRLKDCRTEIVLKENAVLHLKDAAGIDWLTKLYGYIPECREHEKSRPDFTRSAIRWERVAEKYGGIVIAPACVERRNENHWYHTWDCASGCIWSPCAVTELRLLG